MTTLILACHYRDLETLRRCLLASAAATDSRASAVQPRVWQWIVNGARSMGEAYAAIDQIAARTVRADAVIYAHEDVILPAQWPTLVTEALAELDRRDPTWAVAGAFGTWLDSEGRQQYAGWVDDTVEKRRFGIDSLPRRVDTLDALLIIKRPGPPLWDAAIPDFHGYAEDICLSARQAGRGVWAINLPLRHACKLTNAEQLPGYQAAKRYLTAKWRTLLPVATTCGVWR